MTLAITIVVLFFLVFNNREPVKKEKYKGKGYDYVKKKFVNVKL